jgi:hypothetical protein
VIAAFDRTLPVMMLLVGVVGDVTQSLSLQLIEAIPISFSLNIILGAGPRNITG